MIFAKIFDFGQKIRCYAKEVGNFSISKRPKIGAFFIIVIVKVNNFPTHHAPLRNFEIFTMEKQNGLFIETPKIYFAFSKKQGGRRSYYFIKPDRDPKVKVTFLIHVRKSFEKKETS